MDADYKRLVRFLVISWLALLAIVVGLAFWGSYEVKNLHREVANQPAPKIIKGINGQNGVNGLDGVSIVGNQGVQGSQGLQGLQGPMGQTGATGATGPAGPQGNPGTPGREVEFCTQDNGQVGQRYVGDIECQPIDGQD